MPSPAARTIRDAGRLYRGCGAEWLGAALRGELTGADNYASDPELASGYGDGLVAILEPVANLRVRQEPVARRDPDAAAYDAKMAGVDGWRWEVGGAWHYRLKAGTLRVVGVLATGDTDAQPGAVLRAARAWRGWRQSDLAEALGTTQPRVALYESGGAAPGYDRLLRAAAMLPVAVSLASCPGVEMRRDPFDAALRTPRVRTALMKLGRALEKIPR